MRGQSGVSAANDKTIIPVLRSASCRERVSTSRPQRTSNVRQKMFHQEYACRTHSRVWTSFAESAPSDSLVSAEDLFFRLPANQFSLHRIPEIHSVNDHELGRRILIRIAPISRSRRIGYAENRGNSATGRQADDKGKASRPWCASLHRRLAGSACIPPR